MNIKTIIVGSLALGLAIGGTFLTMTSQEKQTAYTPRTINNGGITGQAGYAAYMHMLKEDPATGEIDPNLVNQVRLQIAAIAKKNNKAALGLNWTQMGPDDTGGRTRAILIDKNNANIVYAGSVSGGLFVSTDGTASWTPIASMQGVLGENLAISCITQTDNGRIFFGTGATFEGAFGTGGSGFIGNGVYEYVPSTGATLPVITNTTAVPNNNASSFWSFTNAIASFGNRLYLGTKDGMVWADPNTSGFYPTTFSGWFNPIEIIPGIKETKTCQDIDIAPDGSMLVCFGGLAYVSNQSDALGSFVKAVSSPNPIIGSRLSGAIAPSNPNVMYILGSSGTLQGLHITTDKGGTWDEIVPGGVPSIDPFTNGTGGGGQGGYDDAIEVDPSDWGRVIVGGVRLYEWRHAVGSNPIGGSWLLAATLGGFPFGVHADKHTIVFGDASTIYIGSDGGIAKSEDGGATWTDRNFGYNVTSFYDVATAANGWVLGGSQDNGDLLFSFGNFGSNTPFGTVGLFPTDGQTFGDGFDVAFSNQGPGIAYGTAQFGALWRSAASSAGGGFFDPALASIINGGGQAFHTVIENWEDNNDLTSVDSIQVTFTGPDTLLAGQTRFYPSLSNGTPVPFTPTTTLFLDSLDTLMVQDPIQNRFAMATSNGVYLTRDAARLSASNTEWFRVANTVGVLCLEFSTDGNHLFIGTSAGVRRVSGLNLGNTHDQLDIDGINSFLVTTFANGSGTSGVVTGIAADPNDTNNLIVTTGGYTIGNHVFRCTNATAGLSFVAIQGSTSALPKMPVYDAVIDYTNKDQVIIGTEWGVWTTDNAFSANGTLVEWTDESGNGMTHVPVHGIVQQHLQPWESTNFGSIYLGTHGRGFYRSDDLQNFTSVSVDENEFSEKEGFVTNLNVYPNPLNNNGVLAFNLKENAETTIKIYNLTGSLVKTINLGVKTKGEHKERFNVAALSIGSYIISLESGSEKSVAKFIITR